MQLKKLSDTHYVVVSDEPIEVGDYIMNIERNHIYPSPVLNEDVEYRNKKSDVFKKITHSTQPLEEENGHVGWDKVKHLSLSYIKLLVGEVDVEKKADEYFEREMGRDINDPEKVQFNFHWRKHFINSYNQCLDDNKDKRFTMQDLQNAWIMGYRSDTLDELHDYFEKSKDTWEVEFIDGQLKLK